MPRNPAADSERRQGIALVISDLTSGGAQRVAMALAGHWVGRGNALTLITQSEEKDDFFSPPLGCRRISTGGRGVSPTALGRLFANFRRIAALRRAIKQSKADVIAAFVGQTIITSLIACIGLPVKVIACERNDPARQSLGRPWDFLRRILYRQADLVTANSRSALETLSGYVPRAKLKLLPNSVPSAPNTGAADMPGPMFVAVGRLNHQKGYDILIDALAQLPHDLDEWNLLILGDGPLEHGLKELAETLGVASRIHWAGVQADPYPYYRAGRIFVLASRHEGMPNVVLEATSVGLATIVTDACTGVHDIVKDQISGLVVSAEDSAALAAAMTCLAREPDLRDRFARAATAELENFQPDKILALWDEVIDSMDSRAP
jgi:GalNAc-alpha-(1->4)-GalNAc-alpha-(1->3)-diNAcBac-PP-undecaprenol alpha-1,4-N-acetyl-D-galactosaminyltransferase